VQNKKSESSKFLVDHVALQICCERTTLSIHRRRNLPQAAATCLKVAMLLPGEWMERLTQHPEDQPCKLIARQAHDSQNDSSGLLR
jgi:hypothetical protein